MDYPQLNLLSGLALSILSALYIEVLFLQQMTPAFNQQIGLGLLLTGGVVALVTTIFYRREISPRTAGILFGAQMLASLVCLVLAFGLYRSLVPVP